MERQDERIDGGQGFDWGRTSADYARYRDLYPPVFFEKLRAQGVCVPGQRVLDLGTGTGVLPRAMYDPAISFVGIDCAPEQIAQAKRLAQAADMQIDFRVCAAEALDEPPASFDAVTACQCFFYFRHEILLPQLAKLLRPRGRLAVLFLAWLPAEDPIAGASEELVLRYHPQWTGAGETRHPIFIPDCAAPLFEVVHSEVYDLPVPFTRESWNGRMKACRGVGAALPPDRLAAWEAEHVALLDRIAPPAFSVLHYAALTVLERRDV